MAKNIQMNVLGSDGQYEDIYPQTTVENIVDIQDNYYAKNETLTNTTAALFGLGSDAVPDDVLNILSRFQNGLGNEYLWEKQKTEATATLKIGSSSSFQIDPSVQTTITVYTEATAETDGSVSLSGPVQYSVPMDGSTFPTTIIGTYFNHSGTTIYKITSTNYISGNYQNVVGNIVTSEVTTKTETSYVNSPSPDAYPPATPDGYTYTALGQFGNKVQIETGSYTGTGTYGKNSPNTLTFGFEPKLVVVIGEQESTFSNRNSPLILIYPYNGVTQSPNSYYWGGIITTWGVNSVNWYGDNATDQKNANSYGYIYIALG